MKKHSLFTGLLCLFLLIIVLFSLSLPVGAAEQNGSCGDSAYWKFDSASGQLTLYGSGAVTRSDWSAHEGKITSLVVEDGIEAVHTNFPNYSKLKSVRFADSVSDLEGVSFYNCKKLTEVKLPQNLAEIPHECFADCAALKEIELPKSLSKIGSYAFQNCSALKSIDLPEGITEIHVNTFENCTSLERVSIPSGLQRVNAFAFCNCYALKSIELPETMLSMGESAFYGCAALKEMHIPKGIEKIEKRTFGHCVGLLSVSIPPSVKQVGEDAFLGCEALQTVHIQDLTAWCGIQFYAKAYTFYERELGEERSPYVYASPMHYAQDIQLNGISLTQVRVDDSVTEIGAGAFYGWDKLESVAIPESVTHIRSHCFAFCTNLKRVELPANYMGEIAPFSFYGCISLQEITLPDGVDTIGAYCFQDCTALESFAPPKSLRTLREYAFFGCSALQKVHFPEGMILMGKSAFSQCKSLTEVYLPDTLQDVPGAAFSHCVELLQVRLGSSIHSVDDSAFSYCRKLYSIVLPSSVEHLGQDVFFYCHSLRKVYVLNPELKLGYSSGKLVYCYEGSEAQRYCEEKNYPYGLICKDSHPCDFYTDVASSTCTQSGTLIGKCMLCGVSVKETTPAAGHSMVNNACIYCGYYKPFQDIADNAWYADAVLYAVRNGLMNGVSNTRFEPESPMTRAMLVTVLWRYAGEPLEGENSFTDVPAGQWYTDAVAWAAHNGIVGGVGDNRFDPNGNITREQMAAILYRYCNSVGIDTTKRAELSAFPDGGKVSAYATEALSWAVAEGLINGTQKGSATYLDPQGNATRAQVAAILMRYIENVVK